MKDTATISHATNRLDWLDALRGWAVFGVVMVHSGQVAHSTGIVQQISAAGQYGVQLFFLVSALTISRTYESHISQFGRGVQSQLAWLIKRFFRIAPLYYLAVFFYPIEQYAIYVLSHHHYGLVTRISDILANILFLHTWIPSANNSVVPGGWSIGVEMFFYTLVPFIWLIAPVQRRVTLLGISAIVLLIVTVLANKLLTGSFYVEDNTYLYYWFPAQAPVIILGLIFYFRCGPKMQSPTIRKKIAAVCFAGFLTCFLVALYLGSAMEVAPVVSPMILAASFILLILSLRGWIKTVVVNQYTIFLGKISFSVYIFHFLVLDFIRVFLQFSQFDRSGPLTLLPIFVTALAFTSGIALISKRIIEDPAITYGHKLSRSVALGVYGMRL